MTTSACPAAGPLAVIQLIALPLNVTLTRAPAVPLVRYEPPLAAGSLSPTQLSYPTALAASSNRLFPTAKPSPVTAKPPDFGFRVCRTTTLIVCRPAVRPENATTFRVWLAAYRSMTRGGLAVDADGRPTGSRPGETNPGSRRSGETVRTAVLHRRAAAYGARRVQQCSDARTQPPYVTAPAVCSTRDRRRRTRRVRRQRGGRGNQQVASGEHRLREDRARGADPSQRPFRSWRSAAPRRRGCSGRCTTTTSPAARIPAPFKVGVPNTLAGIDVRQMTAPVARVELHDAAGNGGPAYRDPTRAQIQPTASGVPDGRRDHRLGRLTWRPPSARPGPALSVGAGETRRRCRSCRRRRRNRSSRHSRCGAQQRRARCEILVVPARAGPANPPLGPACSPFIRTRDSSSPTGMPAFRFP